MKIKWLIEERVHPRVGRLAPGEVREVPDDIGRALVAQGEAVAFTPHEHVLQPHSVVHKMKAKQQSEGGD